MGRVFAGGDVRLIRREMIEGKNLDGFGKLIKKEKVSAYANVEEPRNRNRCVVGGARKALQGAMLE